MPAKVELKARGLYTWPNPLSEIPPGGMLLAKNVVIDRESTVEPRRGYSELEYPLGTSLSNRADQLIPLQSTEDLICHYGPSGAPNKLAFFTRVVETTGTITSGSSTISNMPAEDGLYVGQIVNSLPRETIFLGDQTLGSNVITNILSSQGLYVGMSIGGQGIPVSTTISSISGTGPFSITISNNVLYTQAGNTLTATDDNIAGIPANTRIVAINPGNIVLSNNATATSRFFNFSPSAVTTASDTITINNHGFVDGDSVQFSSTGTLPAPIVSNAIYYIILSNSLSFKISDEVDGDPINITTQGTGTHTIRHREDFTAAGWIDYPGTFEKPENNIKMRYAEANNSLYLTTDVGIKVLDNIEGISFRGDVTSGSNVITNVDALDVTYGEFVGGTGIPPNAFVTDLLSANSFEISVNATQTATNQRLFVQPRLAGMPQGLDGEAFLTVDTTGFFTANRAVSYKIVWGKKNFNNKTYVGVPSADIVVSNNTTEAKNVDLRFTVPEDVTPQYFYRIYRSGFSADALSVPPTDWTLIDEANPTFTDIVNGVVLFTDIIPESLRTGAQLYTNETQEGVLLSNYRPPFATDVAAFKRSLFLSNTKTRHNLKLVLNGVSGQFSILADLTNATTFKAKTISNPDLQILGNTTNGSNVISGISSVDMAALAVGQGITGAGIPDGTKVAAFESTTSVRLTKNATATAVAVLLDLEIVGVRIGQTVLATGVPSTSVITDIFFEATHTINTTNGSPILTGFTSTAGLKVGQPVSAGAGIPVGSQILTIDSATQITITDNATATIVGLVTSFGKGARMSESSTVTSVGATVTFKNGSGGLEVGDTVTVAGVTYTASTVEDYAGSNRNFKVYAQGSPAQNITDTALSLVRVVNRQLSAVGSPDVYAFYESTPNSLPGDIRFVARDLNTDKYYATADSTATGAAFTPALPAAGGLSVFSVNDELKNGLSWSKTDQPEAFPLGYNAPIANEKEEIIRIVSLRDSLFNLKGDGVHRITGEDPASFRSTIFDNTLTLAAPESAVAMANAIFMLSPEGVMKITDSKVDIISRPIEDLIQSVFEEDQVKVRTLSYGVAYHSDKKYILYTIENAEDEAPTQAFVYNEFTSTWTVWEMTRTCGTITSKEDLMYLGRFDSNTLKVERKDRKYTDYLDDTFDVSIEGISGVLTSGSSQITLILPDTTSISVGDPISGTGIPLGSSVVSINNNFTITISSPATMSGIVGLIFDSGRLLRLATTNGINVGDVLFQNTGRFSIIKEIDGQKNTIRTRTPINSWTLGTATVLVGIDSEIKYAPVTCGSPETLKQMREFLAFFQTPLFDEVTIGFDSDISGSEETLTLPGQIGGLLWGLYPWGQVIWGGVVRPVPLRTLVPRDKQRCTQLNIRINHREAYAFYRLSGINVFFNAGNERVRR